jgi:hypothetical protein
MTITTGWNTQNILDVFPDVQFYDYTKGAGRTAILEKYKNYDLTYSYTGYNWDICKKMLDGGIRVAVIFKKGLPETFNGYPVIDGDLYDNRTKDKGVIIGLKFKRVREKLLPTDKFVVQ